MEEDENLEQILDKSNEKLHISDVINSSWEEIFIELRLLRENPNSEWSRRFGEGFLESWLIENFNPPTRKNCL